MGLLDYASLYDRFGGDDSSAYPLAKKDKSHLFRQGLLQLAAAMSKPNGGNFANSLATGLLAANQSGQQGAAQYANDAYRGDIMKRTQADMAANTAKQAAWAKLYGPDGAIDPQAEAALRAADPQGYLSNMDKLHPTQKREYHQLDTGAGTVPIFTDDQGNMYDANGQKVNLGGAPQASAAPGFSPTAGVSPGPAFPVQGKDLYASIGAIVAPLGGRITSTNTGEHNPGSLHYQGRAVDIGMARETPEQQQKIISALEAAGYKVRDERQHPAGQAVWGGPHVHVEAPQQVAQSQPRTGFESLPGFAPKAKEAKPSTVEQRSQDLADMQAQGLTITKTMRDQYLMTGKMPGEDGGATPADPLQGLDPATASLVKKIANYEALPSSLGRSSNRADLIGRAAMLNPEYDESQSKSAYTFRQDMGKSSPTSVGGQVTAANTALHHIGTLLKANTALNKAGMDSQFPMVNKMKASLSHQAGASAVNNWNQAVHFVSEEMARLVKGGVASEGEVHDMVSKLDASLSPQQRNDAIAQVVEFLHGRLAAIESHRDDVLGEAGASVRILSPEAQRIYDATEKLKGGGDNVVRYDAQGNRIQ